MTLLKLTRKRFYFIALAVILSSAIATVVVDPADNAGSFIHADARPDHNIRIAVVAGHGNIIQNDYQTPGKQSPEWPDGLKIYEGYSNHLLAKQLALKLEELDFDVDYINPDRLDLSLRDRVFRINKIYLKDPRTVAIFLHHNAQATDNATHPPDYCDDDGFSGWMDPAAGGASGIEVFTSRGDTGSDELATCVIRSLMAEFPDWHMRVDLRDGDPDKEANFYVLRKTFGRAILIEFGFMTTYTDCLKIADPLIRERYVDAIICGIYDYLDKQCPAPISHLKPLSAHRRMTPNPCTS